MQLCLVNEVDVVIQSQPTSVAPSGGFVTGIPTKNFHGATPEWGWEPFWYQQRSFASFWVFG